MSSIRNIDKQAKVVIESIIDNKRSLDENVVTQTEFIAYTLITTDPVIITDDTMILPALPVGDIVHNMAIIITDPSIPNIVDCEVTCTVKDNLVLFNKDDDVNNKYGIVSFITAIRI